MMKENILADKSYQFNLDTVKIYKKIISEQKDFILSKQILKCGTSIGATIAEANGAISTADFSSKISIAYKESLESKYWLSLLKDSEFISIDAFEKMFEQADELSRILYSILKKIRLNKRSPED